MRIHEPPDDGNREWTVTFTMHRVWAETPGEAIAKAQSTAEAGLWYSFDEEAE